LEYPVTAGETYHFMIAIADAGDGIYDSGVLIQSESFCGNTWFQVAEFTAQEVAGLEYQFQNYSSRADSYIWEFGDGDVSIEESPTHVFDSPGEYEVSLTCSNECFDTTTTVILNVGMVTGIGEQIEIESMVTNVGLDAIRVQCELGRSANVRLRIVDMVGRTVWSEAVGTTNRFTKNVNVSAFKKGMYLMQIDAGKSTSIQRFVKF
ncbi:MAG: PKD domain-containing protein, partial [Flavobacteriales bacterium]